jgi:TonB family protein
MFLNGCETAPPGPVNTAPPGPVHNQVTFSGDYITIEQADVRPHVIRRFQVPPHYPSAMHDAGIYAGKAIIAFMVEQDGHTSQVQVEFATTPEFGEAAKEAIEQWIFTPGMRNGVPVRVARKEPISFDSD